MTLKTKLIANMLVTAAIIVGISLASFSSMHFIQGKLAYIAEKSAPFQMGTVAFQRELQSYITDLVKVNAARTMQEYARFREEAEQSLVRVKKDQHALEGMHGDRRLDMSGDLDQISGELFAATEARIQSDSAAGEANIKVSQRMKESSARLKELEAHIRELQVTRAASFAKALATTDLFSARLRSLEELRNQVKDLLAVAAAAHNAQNSTAFLIVKGKANTLLGRIAKSKNAPFISSDLKVLTADLNGFLQLQAEFLSQKDDGSKKWAFESLKELTEKLNRLYLDLHQEAEMASSQLAIGTNRQGVIFAQSNSANSILLANAELVALGLTVTGDINRLFTLGSPAELDTLDSELRSLFAEIDERARLMEISLAKLDARDEITILHTAVGSLSAIRTELYSAAGIMSTLKRKLSAIEQANRSTDKLHAMVIKQSAQGDESISAARGGQENAIAAVNSMVRRSLSQVYGIGLVAIVIGILFGFWIYRSVLLPLGVVLGAVRRQQEQGEEKASLAEAVAGGDLNREVIVSEAITLDSTRVNSDEMGMVLGAIVSMSAAQVTLDRAFAAMTASLRSSRDLDARRDRLKSGLYELNKILRVEHTSAELADEALAFMADFLGAGVGIMYLYDEKGEMLQTLSTYAISRTGRLNWGFRLGEGLPGQVALERKMICLNVVPPDYIPITSALGTAAPLTVAILPILHNDTLVGVLELGSFRRFDDDDFTFLTQALEGVAITINVNRSRQLVNDLLEQTQAQAEELLVQQEELQQTNEELEERAQMLTERRRPHDR